MWCDDEMYPRKLFVSMTNGKSNWRCACFKELGWSDVRKVRSACTDLGTRGISDLTMACLTSLSSQFK